MNKKLADFMRNEIKKGLSRCTQQQQYMFRRCFSHNNLELPLNDIVDNIPEDNLNVADGLVKRTLEKAGE